MAEYILTEKSNLVAVADSIRERTGGTGKITLGEMINDINYEISGGIDTSDATASENEILLGETAYVDGEKITGTIPTKTASNLTASGATITVPSGYYATQATKSVATATQATPSVSIDSAGKITATATQTAGYVSAGTETGTKQLTTQAAKTITPSTSSQTAVANGVYTTGAVTVAAVPTQTKSVTPSASSQDVTADSGKFLSKVTVSGDENLTAENIKSGVSIFGVDGTLSGNDTPTNVTLNFSWTATSSNYAPEVFYSHINKNNSKLLGGTYIAPSTTGSTTLTVAKNSIIVIICRNTTSSLYGVYSYSTSDGIVSLPNGYSSSARYGNSLFLINNDGQLTVSMGYHGGGGSND